MRLLALLAVAAVAATAHLVGHSVEGRRIVAYELGDPAAARKVLVVGCLHGTELHSRSCFAQIASTSGWARTRTRMGTGLERAATHTAST